MRVIVVYRYMTQKLFAFAKGKCCAESCDNPMFQEVLLAGHLYQNVLKVYIVCAYQNVRENLVANDVLSIKKIMQAL